MQDKDHVVSCGPFAVVEGDVDGITFCWVERDGECVSNYGSIDYAEEIASKLYNEYLEERFPF